MNVAFASGILVPQTFFGLEYFLGFREHFANSDVRALFPGVPVTSPIAQRAEKLAEALNQALADGTFEADKKIHIIAHSMGGLDCRFLISQNFGGLRGRLGSVTTLCTPHRGSPIADLLVGRDKPTLLDPRRVVVQLIESALLTLGVNLGGFEELTTDSTKTLAIREEDLKDLDFPFFSVAGVGHPSPPPTTFPLLATHSYIDAVTHEPNDGLVSLSSAWFGTFLGEWPADHFEAVGHNLDPFRAQEPFNPLPLVDDILQRLRTL
jgi:triacylglycerol lipase